MNLPSDERLRALASLVWLNPFGRERLAGERVALGGEYVADESTFGETWDPAAVTVPRQNLVRLRELACGWCQALRDATAARQGRRAEVYADLCIYDLFCRVEPVLSAYVEGRPADLAGAWTTFRDGYRHHFGGDGCRFTPEHLFALNYQARRAFFHIFTRISGSGPAAALRARVWQSLFTHDSRRYAETFWTCMTRIPTLVRGETGTGKELVARAIALCQYVPFDARTRTFADDKGPRFVPLHLAAVPSTLVESELFGHKRGSFTGASTDRVGRLETVSPCGAVFLDEVAELAPDIQVKLLRLLQERTYTRVGGGSERTFRAASVQV